MYQLSKNQRKFSNTPVTHRKMSTHVRRAGMNKGLAAGLLVAVAGAAYINSSIKENPRKSYVLACLYKAYN